MTESTKQRLSSDNLYALLTDFLRKLTKKNYSSAINMFTSFRQTYKYSACWRNPVVWKYVRVVVLQEEELNIMLIQL